MTLSEIRQVLSERGIQLTKSLGQNFLHDQNQIRKIVAIAQLTEQDKVLEIGPGLGPLTEMLVSHAGHVLAIEKDARLVQILRERFSAALAASQGQTPVLELLHDDGLEYLQREHRNWLGWKMVANLPYSVASPILVELAQNPQGPERLVATLQIEVARRLAAQAGAADYGILTLLAQLNYEPAGFFKVPAACFFPEPDVDSGCVCLVRRAQPLLEPERRQTFVELVKQAFSQRRKMMLKLLKTRWPAAELESVYERAGISPQARAESVSLEQFVQLARLLPVPSRHD